MTEISLNRRSFIATTGAAMFAMAPTASLALTIPKEQLDLRLSVGGRQRMLSQRMAKAVAFTRLGVEETRMLEQLATARDMFDDAMQGFLNGEGDTGLTRERAFAVQRKLDEVVTEWEAFGAHVASILASGSVSDTDLDGVVALNGPLLDVTTAAAKKMTAVYGNQSVDIRVFKAIDISGRQLMLSQKMTKEVGLISLDHQAEAYRESFAETTRLFSNSLIAMSDSAEMFGISQGNAETSAKIAEIKSMWKEQIILNEGVAGGDPLTGDQLATYMDRSEALFAESGNLVGLYQTM